ncbi:hypothetical protein SAMN05192545_3912 [Maribacter dokdonensis]|uniref:Uncharacterized protein n=1 Tax=Maribacter dokdonensis TaxID=320912 RepID=A0ABY0V0I8_9FLAO|nr:hypothetical protein SAMN05192545_3912 [Maribacter dokdonensis]
MSNDLIFSSILFAVIVLAVLYMRNKQKRENDPASGGSSNGTRPGGNETTKPFAYKGRTKGRKTY